MKKKILIIGGAGFIGINAAEKFINIGWEVTILDNMSRRGTNLNLKWLSSIYSKKYRFVKADITSDQKILDREVAKHDTILHLAAQVAVTTSILDPYNDLQINAIGTFNVLEAIRKIKGVKPLIIYASTNKVYGDLTELRVIEKAKRYELKDFPQGVHEKNHLDFHSPYGCSKGAAEQYVRDYSRIYGLKTVVFRQSCIYGMHQFGIEDQGWIAWFVIATLLKKPIKLYGNGKQVRDVLFVEDLVNLYYIASTNVEKVSGHIYNVGGGRSNSVSILELFDLLEKNHGLKIEYEHKPIRPGDQKIFISDNRKIMKATGWKPVVGLKHGVGELLRWTKENLKLIESLY